mmetsp:Transcript_708/g.1492  ORF Transcript_708/g.1492 Transcript_708/m.1492 type:complete len:445 (-) Transcript_708:499-1833(-)
MCTNSEEDPLLRKEGSEANGDKFLRRQERKRKRRNCALFSIAFAFCIILYGVMIFFKHASDPSRTRNDSIVARAKQKKAMVQINPMTGEYSIDYDGDYSSAIAKDTTTFAELAERMLLPWYEASVMAIMEDPAWEDGINPSSAAEVRRVLLITRDMLDVFSPVFPGTPLSSGKNPNKDHSLWKKLRTLYRSGYQKLGKLKDLDELTYSKKLLTRRVNAVTKWKKDFLAFQRAYRIRHFLYQPLTNGGGIDHHGCYYHDASHLFWAETRALPCGDSLGVGSLRSLASVQLQHSLEYLQTVRNYTSVLPRKQEEMFHNLRKELRIFVDEFNIFRNVLVTNNNGTSWYAPTSVRTKAGDAVLDVEEDEDPDDPLGNAMSTLNVAQIKLGEINDRWTALDIYKKDQSHLGKQEKMAAKVDKAWHKFLVWQEKRNLEGTIQFVLDQMKD